MPPKTKMVFLFQPKAHENEKLKLMWLKKSAIFGAENENWSTSRNRPNQKKDARTQQYQYVHQLFSSNSVTIRNIQSQNKDMIIACNGRQQTKQAFHENHSTAALDTHYD